MSIASGLFARDRRTSRITVPGHENEWMVFQGLTGRKLGRSQNARFDSAVAEAGTPENFKRQAELMLRDIGEDKVRKQKDDETICSQYDPLVLGVKGIAEWSLKDGDGKVIDITEENIDELTDDIRKWMVLQILTLNHVVGKGAKKGNA